LIISPRAATGRQFARIRGIRVSVCFLSVFIRVNPWLKEFSLKVQEVFDDRTQGQHRQKI
jgi:hypothetical protein